MTNDNQIRHISLTETASLIRAALKRKFPATKFSVRSKSYSMGCSITVRWEDGPAIHLVDPITHNFAGAGFDGMIDMKYYTESYLLPDGTAQFARTSGTGGSRGSVPEACKPMPAGAERVQFGADYVFCERRVTDQFKNAIRAKFAAATQEQRSEMLGDAWHAARGINSWEPKPDLSDFGYYADDVFHAMVRRQSESAPPAQLG